MIARPGDLRGLSISQLPTTSMIRILLREAGTTTFFILVLIVDAVSKLAWIRRITDGAVLPGFIPHKLALEVESVVDIGKSELDVVMLDRQN
jgi:hypothetical protein